MIEVHPNLYVGDESAVLEAQGDDWFIVHACKEPYHRAALGYKAAGAPKGHPERLVAHRPGCVILNLIDAPTADMIPDEVVLAALQSIGARLLMGKVLVHCNRGESRAPTLALLYLALHTDRFDDCDHDQAVERFSQIYPAFRPNAGMQDKARQIWTHGFGGHAELPDRIAVMTEPDHSDGTQTDWPPKARTIFTF